MYGDEIFSSDPPIPASKKAQIPPPSEKAQEKPKRKYNRRVKPENDNPEAISSVKTDDTGALVAAEGLFEDEQLLGYYMINAFIRLYNMVKPEDRKELAKIIEGLVSNPRPATAKQTQPK